MIYKETKHGGMTHRHRHFDTIRDLVNFIDTTPTNDLFKTRSLASRRVEYGDNSWSGTECFDSAIDLLYKGWNPGAIDLAKQVKVSAAQSRIQTTKPSYSTVGYQASVPRYLQGIPTNMVTRTTTAQKQKIITVYKSLSYNSRTQPEHIKKEGVKALQIIQALEGKGYRVKLNMYWLSHNHTTDAFIFSLTVKRPEERLSLLKMAFPLIHPAMLRRIGFAVMEKDPNLKSNYFTQAYGRSDGELFQAEKGSIVLPSFINDKEVIINGF